MKKKDVSDMTLDELRAEIVRFDKRDHVPRAQYSRYDSIVRRIASLEGR